jgi:hypothetical protein
VSDITMMCIVCGEEFLWTDDDQKFFKQKGFHPPKRCEKCRRARRQEKEADRVEKKRGGRGGNR